MVKEGKHAVFIKTDAGNFGTAFVLYVPTNGQRAWQLGTLIALLRCLHPLLVQEEHKLDGGTIDDRILDAFDAWIASEWLGVKEELARLEAFRYRMASRARRFAQFCTRIQKCATEAERDSLMSFDELACWLYGTSLLQNIDCGAVTRDAFAPMLMKKCSLENGQHVETACLTN